jgi:hypothetical protein
MTDRSVIEKGLGGGVLGHERVVGRDFVKGREHRCVLPVIGDDQAKELDEAVLAAVRRVRRPGVDGAKDVPAILSASRVSRCDLSGK